MINTYKGLLRCINKMLTYNELIRKLKGKEAQAIISILLSNNKKEWSNVDIVHKIEEGNIIQGKKNALRVRVSRTISSLNKIGILKVYKIRKNRFYGIQPYARESLLSLMAPYSDYERFSHFDPKSIFNTKMGVTIYGLTKETGKKYNLEIINAIFAFNNITSKLEKIKDKQREEFLLEYIKNIKKGLNKNPKLKRFIERNKKMLLILMSSKEALFMEKMFSDNKNKYFKRFKGLNKNEKTRISKILEKGVFESIKLFPDKISISIHDGNSTFMPNEIHDLIYAKTLQKRPITPKHLENNKK